MNKSILYCGDSWEGGAANYLLGALRRGPYVVTHVPPSMRLSPAMLEHGFDAIILSDYSREMLTAECDQLLEKQVQGGAGLLMIGGWGSFSGIFGKWRGSRIANLLPVECSERDDRMNIMTGATLHVQTPHAILGKTEWHQSPVICGLNLVTAKAGSITVLTAHEILQEKSKQGFNLKESSEALPLLVVDAKKKIAALATDVAPHWCGGLVDWGERREKLKVNPMMEVEVGNRYVEFLAGIFSWLTGK